MGMAGRTCWAASLGDCDGGASREHLISRSQLDSSTIIVSGLPWCREPREVGLASLVAKTLCARHNSALSPVDEEMQRFKGAIESIVAGRLRTSRLDARLVERWLLKTTVTLAMQDSSASLPPLSDLARVAFGHEAPPYGQGFFLVAHLGEQKPFENGQLTFTSLNRKDTGRIAVAQFGFHGWTLVFAFDQAPQLLGAMRILELRQGTNTLTLKWMPPLAPTDRVMSPLVQTK